MTERKFFGKANGEDIYAFTLTDGDLQVTVIEYGASVQSIKFRGKELVLGFGSAEEYAKKTTYFGATVGRVANRVGGASFVLDGRKYVLDDNDNGNCLHGGFSGYDGRTFRGEICKNTVKFTYLSKDGDQGFCGTLRLTVEYALKDNTLAVTYTAVSDKDTYFAPTNHTFFNFSGTNAPVYDTLLTINADGFTPVNEKLLPTGEIKSVKGTAFDFTSPKAIGADICRDEEQLKIVGGGYDHNFVLRGEAAAVAEYGGVKMEVSTDMSGLQFYSGNFLNGEKTRGGVFDKHGAFCLEPQFFPNAVNQPNFEKPLLPASSPVTHYIKYKFAAV